MWWRAMCHKSRRNYLLITFLVILLPLLLEGAISGYKEGSPTQYHIQTDEGSERFFRFQTYNGQYRKERRLDDGTVIGSYGWVDPTGFLRMTDYIADSKGYRVLKNSMQYVGTNSILEESTTRKSYLQKETYPKKLGNKVNLRGMKLPFKVVKKKILVEPGYSPSQVSTRKKETTTEGPVLLVYGPLRSGNVHGGRLVKRRRRPQGTKEEFIPVKEDPSDPFRQYATPLKPSSNKASAFIYNIPRRQYHKEETERDGSRTGSYGYVDPFGIRRVIHYSANSQGFQAARDFKYVGNDEGQQEKY